MNIIPQSSKDANRLAFDVATARLSGQGMVISKIKSEIVTMCGKFASMVEIINAYPDKMTDFERQLYDVQVQAFMHACFMYLGFTDADGNPYINPVTAQSQTTDIKLTITLPHYTKTVTIATIDNIVFDIYNWDLLFGTSVLSILDSTELATQYSTVAETPTQYFSKSEFIAGVVTEMEKLISFEAEICRMEQVINSAMRYISELKNIGLYN